VQPSAAAGGRPSAEASGNLDLGMTVTVYCAETARRLQARDGSSAPADFTEH
jgi:hypothetical protein